MYRRVGQPWRRARGAVEEVLRQTLPVFAVGIER